MMRFREWFKRHATPDDPRLRRWRESWARIESSATQADIARLAGELERFDLSDDEIEIEREMLQALLDREELSSATRSSGLPLLETGHRAVRGEPCHYSAPASIVDESAQPSGRLLLTAGRAIFVGGGTSVAVPWHAVSAAVHADRDIVLVKNGHEAAYRFRCNTYSDALCAAFVAREILASRRPSTPGL
jgi:hypothetical protein